MSDAHAGSITLGQQRLAVQPLPLGQLRRLLPVFTRVGRSFGTGQIDDESMQGLIEIIALAVGKPVDELEAIPCTYADLLHALATISQVCGLSPREGASPGESAPGPATPPTPGSTPGTPSTGG